MRLPDFPLHSGVEELLRSGVQPFSWAFRNLIGQDREWTATAQPRDVSSSANVNPLDDVILVDCSASAVTMVLETAVGCDGRQHTFKKIDATANAFTLDGNGSETIDGTASLRYIVQNYTVTVKSDGVNWRRVSEYSPGGRYTPTLTKVSNVDTASAFECVFTNFGAMGIVAGRVNVDPTSADAATNLQITVPVPSDFASQNDLAGVAFCRDIQQGAALRAETSANAALLQFLPNSNASDQPFFFIFAYALM